MHTENLYRQIREMIADKQFEALSALNIVKPKKFNWVTEVFENINLKNFPHAQALVWTDGEQTRTFSFEDLSVLCNRFLNFLRKHGLRLNGVIFSQMSLVPEN